MTTIIVSSKRNSAREIATKLADQLSKTVSNATIFNGVEKITAPNMNLLDAIPHVASNCDVLLVVIGTDWTTETAWLSNQKDFNRIALSSALQNNRRVIPVLLDNVQMPPSHLFVGDLSAFNNLSPVPIRASSFVDDVNVLIQKFSGQTIKPPSTHSMPKASSDYPVGNPPPVSNNEVIHQPVIVPPVNHTNIALQVSQSTNLIIGQTINSGVTLYTLPHEASVVRTEIHGVKPVAVIARDKYNQWLNIVHVSTTQQQLIGWVMTSQVENLSYQGNSIQILDLTITNYENHSMEEVAELVKLEKSRGNKFFFIWFSGIVFSVMAGIGLSMVFPNSIFVGLIVGLAIFLGFLVYTIVKTNPISKRVQELEEIRKSKRSGAQVTSEAIAATAKATANAAVGIAALIGAAALLNNNKSKHK